MGKVLFQIIASILGLYLAQKFIPGVSLKPISGDSVYFGYALNQSWQVLVLTGGALGLMNTIVKPILKAVTLPLRIITFGLFSFVINILIVWVADIIFPELVIDGLIPLFWTTVIVWILGWFLARTPLQKNS
ncbi:MAG: phage holin family protein [bacterium]|nr:phage holin family protein [bacterium]